MASNYTQPQPSENSPLDGTLDASLEDHDVRLQRRFNQAFEASRVSNSGHQSDAILPNFNYAPAHRILNDTYLIQRRRIYSDQKARKSFDLMCEDKISKHKLEEVHFSLPSSVKSTFIMTFSPDGRKVASTHGDHRIYICDLNTGKLLDTLEGHPKTPWCLAWHRSNRNILASGCLAGEVRVWDLRSKACESWTSENNTIITSLDFHPKERVLVIATANDIYFWDWSDNDPFAKTTTTHDKEKVKFVEFDSSGTKLVTGISNLPKFAGYSGDSLQNRIIDSYLNQGTLDQLSTENMTQHSEITNNPISGNPNSNENINDRSLTHLSSFRQLIANAANNTEQDINYRSTLTLSRVAFLYRQLEGLEDSMRHTSFSPYISPQLSGATVESSGTIQNVQERNDNPQSSSSALDGPSNDNEARLLDRETTPSPRAPSQGTTAETQMSDNQSGRSGITPHAFEPFLVSFDESLEQLQLPPLIVDGQTISLATVIEQYPVEIPYQLHYVMQFESINQVNQNFIRISKLMSSVKLYRQIVQQIIASNSGQNHYQPNQILTAQSASPRSSRNTSNLPIVFREFAFGNSADSSSGLGRTNRSTDPILAVQYRHAARNVSLVTVCKIDLLSARSVCTMRSQQLIEQTLSSLRQQTARNQPTVKNNITMSTNHDKDSNRQNEPSTSSSTSSDNNNNQDTSFYPLLKHLHQTLTNINHAPLTTSNVHFHITSLRTLIQSLLKNLSSMFRSREEGQRLKGLIHDIAHSLTGRSWSIPLGATLNDIRLDVIHTLCIVDLTLHLTRQVQLLQMQRLSALTRIEESKRTSSNRDSTRSQSASNASASNPHNNSQQARMNSEASIESASLEPSTSRGGGSDVSITKRKELEPSTGPSDCSSKKRKVDTVDQNTLNLNSANDMIETHDTSSAEVAASFNQADTISQSIESLPANQANVLQNSSPESLSADRLVLWNSTHTQAVEQSLQRFLVATTSSMNNSHILVRIYHRLYGSPTIPQPGTLDQTSNRSSPIPYESRRRALSQDNSSASATLESGIPISDEARQRQANLNQTTPSSVSNPNGLDAIAGSRQPHLHIYQTRGSGQHLWFNQYTIPLPVSNCNYRIQCWNFSLSAIPSIKNSQTNVITQKCRIHNDSSIDISSDGGLIACLVPRDDGACIPSFDLKVFSLKTLDLGACYYQLAHGSNAISVSLSPSGSYAVVGLASTKFISNDPNDDDIAIAKVFKLNGKDSYGFVRDIKIKRDDSSLSLNAIRWMSRGIVYNVGPQHHQRYQATRMRNRVA